MTPVAFLDASVLYPSTIRSVLMFLAAFEAFCRIPGKRKPLALQSASEVCSTVVGVRSPRTKMTPSGNKLCSDQRTNLRSLWRGAGEAALISIASTACH